MALSSKFKYRITLFDYHFQFLLLFCLQFFPFWVTKTECQSHFLKFSQLDAKNGLSSPYNDFIYTDSRGLNWISSVDGVFNFDGRNIRQYKSNQSESGLVDDNVQSNFFEQSNGDVWFATYEGINCYDRSKDIFTRYQISNPLGDRISKSYGLFYLEKDSLLWLRASSAIYTFNISTHQADKIIDTKGVRFTPVLNNQKEVQQIYACLWNNGPGFELISITPKKKGTKKYYSFEKFSSGGSQLEIIGAVVSPHQQVFLFSTQGLIRFDPELPDSLHFVDIPGSPKNIVPAGVSIDNSLAFAVKNSGLFLYDISTSNLLQFKTKNLSDDIASTQDDIRTIYKDQNDFIWTSSLQGIRYAWLFPNKFQNVFSDLPKSQVNSIVETQDGQIWCATEQNGIYLFHQNGNVLNHLYSPISTNTNQPSPIKQLTVNENNKVLALSRSYIFEYNRTQKGWSNILNSYDDKFYSFQPVSDSSLMITTMYSDSIIIFNHYTKMMRKYCPLPGINGMQILSHIDNFFYLSDNVNNIYRLNYSLDQLNIHDTINIDADVYSISAPSSIHETVWLGTLNGLKQINRLTRDEVKPESRFEINQIRESPIFSLELDDQEKLWFTTSSGIWMYDNVSGLVNQYRVEDGLPNTDFVINVSLKSSNGNLWFGTSEGILFFNPSSIQPYPYGPKVFIKSLSINSEYYNKLPVINETSQLELKHYQNHLEFEIHSATNYFPKLSSLYYHLQGYHNEWFQIKNNRISFTNLAPGQYNLKVYAVNTNGIRGSMKRINILIAPPFWKTIWFRLTLLIFISGIIYGLSRWYFNRQLQKERAAFERQRALQNERNRIASELHDDLGSGLSIIRFLSESGTTQHQLGDLLQTINKIASTSTELLEKMSDIIWAMNTSNDYLENLIIYLRRYAYEYLDTHGITCVFERPEKIPEIELSGKVRRNILLSFKEILHNVVKHAGATSVQVMLHFETSLIISIQDNGRGFSGQPSPTSGGGNGLINIQKRMNEIQGSATFLGQDGLQVILQTPIAPGSSKAQQKL